MATRSITKGKHTMSTIPKIFAFNLNSERTKKLEALCKPLGIRVQTVPETKFRMSIGHIAGVPGISARAEDDSTGADLPAEEMLLFSGVDDKGLDDFLDAVKQSDFEPVALKAIVTPYNLRWSAVYLFTELKKEREAYSRR